MLLAAWDACRTRKRCRRVLFSHCAAGRRLPVHLQLEDVAGGSLFLDSLIELDELYKTVQQRVDGVQKWSVQMY